MITALITLLVGTQALAGDLYFVCSQYLDSEGVDEEFVVNRTIEDRKITETFIPTMDPSRLYRVSYDPQTRNFEAILKSRSTGRVVRKISTTMKYNRSVELSKNIYCVIAD